MTEPARYLLVPGFSQTGAAWEAVIPYLPAGSEPALLEIPQRLDFVPAAAELARRGRGVWAGYSMGGRLCLQVALDHPEAVVALVLISTSPGIADPEERARRRETDDELADWIEQQGRDAFLDHWMTLPLFAGLDPAGFRRHRLGSATAIAEQLRHLGPGIQEPLWDRLGELAVPVTIVAGERDAAYVAIAGQMAAAIGNRARVLIVTGAGHAVLQQQPEVVGRLLARL